MKAYGTLSGIFFLGISLVMVFIFRQIMTIINNESKLSETMLEQKSGLRLMMVFVFLSYFCCSAVNFGYGYYRNSDFFDLFTRWLLYPFTSILLEVPNVLAVYVIHWRAYQEPSPDHAKNQNPDLE